MHWLEKRLRYNILKTKFQKKYSVKNTCTLKHTCEYIYNINKKQSLKGAHHTINRDYLWEVG